MRSFVPTGLCLFALTTACTEAPGPEGTASIELTGQREQQVAIPFTLQAEAKGVSEGEFEITVTLSPGDSITPPPPEVAVRTLQLSSIGETFEIPLVCEAIGTDLVIVAVRRPGKETAIDTAEFEVACETEDYPSATGDDSDSGAETTATGTSPKPPDVGGTGLESTGADSSSETGDPISDSADFIAIDYTERMYGLFLGVNPALLGGADVPGGAMRLRVETVAGERVVLANYQVNADLGVMRGRVENLDAGLERIPIRGAEVLNGNAFNGQEFVVVGNGIWLVDDDGVREANSPDGAFSAACDEMACVAGPLGGGFLRSADGGENWSLTSGSEEIRLLVSGGGMFMGVDSFNLGVIISDDGGQTWAPTGFESVSGIANIRYGQGQFVASGGVGVYHFRNGMEWVEGNLPFMSLGDFSYSARAERWAGVGYTNELAMSEDGVTWTLLKGVQGETLFRVIAGL